MDDDNDDADVIDKFPEFARLASLWAMRKFVGVNMNENTISAIKPQVTQACLFFFKKTVSSGAYLRVLVERCKLFSSGFRGRGAQGIQRPRR